MKRMRIALAIMLLVVTATAIVPAARADVINTSVTSKVISLAVDTASVNFGAVGAGGNALSASIMATNTGNVVATFTALCSSPANRVGGGGSWALGAAAGSNIFNMLVEDGDNTNLGSGLPESFVTGVAASGGTGPFALRFNAPTVVTNGGQYTWNVTIAAVE